MRIVHLASGREWRGGQRQTWLLARELERLEVRQTVVTRRNGELHRRLEADGVPVAAAAWHLGLDPRALLPMLGVARAGPTILHAHDPHALALGVAVAGAARRPLVVTRRAAFRLRRPALWRRADRVIAISEAVRAQLVADGIDPERIAVVASGVDLAAAAGVSPGDWRERLGIPAGGRLAVTTAALTAEKGIATLVDAAALLHARDPLLRWAVAGDGPLRPMLTAQAEAAGLGQIVHFLGHLPTPLPLVASADCFVMPSLDEAFGTSIVDALALGVPVVASAAGGIPEVVGTAGVLVPPGDPRALADAVAAVLSDAAQHERLSGAAREQARHFGADRMAREVAAVYRSLGSAT